jgi:hypothetical protein
MLLPDFENTEGRLAAYRLVRNFFRGLFAQHDRRTAPAAA